MQVMKLLLTSIGKRVQLIQHLQKNFQVLGADASSQNAARHFADKFFQVPKCRESGYVDALLKICNKEEVAGLIPLYEAEFPILNASRERFEELGVHLILSGERVTDICNDKVKSAAFFNRYGIPSPRAYSPEEAEKEDRYPMIVKPVDGMGSRDVFRVMNREQLRFFAGYVSNPMIQSCARGTEYTIDVLCDEGGTPVYIVPRIRLEVRSGEVVKSRTVKQGLVIRETMNLLEALKREGSVAGPLTVQCFLSDNEDEISFIEINPRFGGGVPLSFAAGADYSLALADMCEGKRWSPRTEEEYLADFTELTMLRYDQAVYM